MGAIRVVMKFHLKRDQSVLTKVKTLYWLPFFKIPEISKSILESRTDVAEWLGDNEDAEVEEY